MTRHLLDVDDLTPAELARVLDLADAPPEPVLAGRTVALYFEKQSLRTRHSCEVATVQLGGYPLSFTSAEVQIGEREPADDVARVLSGYHSIFGARVFDQALLSTFAGASSIPIVNLLSDVAHPCQTLADLQTMRRELGGLEGRTVCWVGDFNNVARSLALGAAMSGMRVHLACPAGYGPTDADLDRLRLAGLVDEPLVTSRPDEAAKGADAVHTDVWTSMGQEAETQERNRAFEGFQVDDTVMAAANEGALFMHCLPAHRGEEVSASVADGPQSRMIVQAHARMTSVRGLFRWLHEVGALPA